MMLSDILFNPQNWRIHPKYQQEALVGVLEEIGWVQNVVVNKTTGNLVDGHLRCQLAERAGEVEIPVTFVELSAEEEKIILTVLDPISSMASTDKDQLEGLLKEVETGNESILQLLEDIKKNNHIGDDDIEEKELGGVDDAYMLKWDVEPGCIFRLGDHRLICGDSTDEKTYTRLMDGKKAQMCMTDPSWAVDYKGGRKEWRELKNDNNADLYAGSIGHIFNNTDPEAALYFVYGALQILNVYKSFIGSGYKQRCVIVWNKNNAQFGYAMAVHYKQKHEMIAYLTKEGEKPYWFGARNETTVWDIPRETKNKYHPTQKPVELYVRGIKNSCPVGGIVLEPFLGGGSCLIACTENNRICYASELDPIYVGVSIERWHEYTGLMPARIE